MSLNLPKNLGIKCHYHRFSYKETDAQGEPKTPASRLENGGFSPDATAVSGVLSLDRERQDGGKQSGDSC